MELNFSNEYYKNMSIYFAKKKDDIERDHSLLESFFTLIHDIKPEDLSNLMDEINKFYKIYGVELSTNDCYALTQGRNVNKIENNELTKQIIYTLANEIIDDGKTLGENYINETVNTSSWLSHSIYESRLCGLLAEQLNLDKEHAMNLGLLHDYGRKYIQDINHVTKGFEKLIDIGYFKEAFAPLTHSFINGGRCASNEKAEPGFYIDQNGNPCWMEGIKKDDVTLFLENYKYDTYDDILNIADLMATSYGIVSPEERIEDVAKRRELDPINRKYFLCEFSNKLLEFSNKLGFDIPEDMNFYSKPTNDVSLDFINEKFKTISNCFYNGLSEKIENNNLSK